MNPVYLFFFKDRTSNLLCPLSVEYGKVIDQDTATWIDGVGNKSALIKVGSNNTYKFIQNNGQSYSVSLITYNAAQVSQRIITNVTQFTPNTTEKYIAIQLPAIEPSTLGVFTGNAFEEWNKGICKPIYKSSAAIDFSKENEYEFFRRILSDELTFLGKDYDYILSKTISHKFELCIFISYNKQYYTEYWNGYFYWSDCKINIDDKTVEITPLPNDDYSNIIAGLEREFDLIKLKAPKQKINYYKRPCYQFYVAGSSVIGCFMTGMYWEQDADPTFDYSTLYNTYKFGLIKQYVIYTAVGSNISDANGYYINKQLPSAQTTFNISQQNKYHISSGYRFVHPDSDTYQIFDNNNILCYQNNAGDVSFPLVLYGNQQAGISDTITIESEVKSLYGRFIHDVSGTGSETLPTQDITDSRNYHYSIRLNEGYEEFISGYLWFSNEPTEWGEYWRGWQNEGYYNRERDVQQPMARNSWDMLSLWINNDKWDIFYLSQTYYSSVVELREAYPLHGVINTLLKQINADVSFALSAQYSSFLYNLGQTLYITPKSNIVVSNYDTPAQQAPITLKNILDALRDMFRCYWFVKYGMLRIEHIRYFMNGGSYNEQPVVGRDLTIERNIRNNKPLDYGQNTYTFDKSDMPERYEFGWMDEVSDDFRGQSLIILSPFVNQSLIEQVIVSKFTSDIDYMLINPDAISKDGFAILGCDNQYKVLMINRGNGYYLQNGNLSFDYLQQYYLFDLPCEDYKIGENGTPKHDGGTRRIKTQEVSFPALEDVDLQKLIKTSIGEGQIEKLTINLSSRNGKATLKF